MTWGRARRPAFADSADARQRKIPNRAADSHTIRGPESPERLAENARIEPFAWDRVQNLLALVGGHPEHLATRSALRDALEDESAEVRLQAGFALGAEGRATLV